MDKPAGDWDQSLPLSLPSTHRTHTPTLDAGQPIGVQQRRRQARRPRPPPTHDYFLRSRYASDSLPHASLIKASVILNYIERNPKVLDKKQSYIQLNPKVPLKICFASVNPSLFITASGSCLENIIYNVNLP